MQEQPSGVTAPRSVGAGTQAAPANRHGRPGRPFLALKISYADELARFADVVGGDIMHVVLGMGLDPRIGMDGMRPGLGFAGCCVPPSDNFRYRSPTAKACGNEHRPYQNRQVAIGPRETG